jgi:hypothetical protein
MEPLAATAMATFGRRFCTGRFLFGSMYPWI